MDTEAWLMELSALNEGHFCQRIVAEPAAAHYYLFVLVFSHCS